MSQSFDVLIIGAGILGCFAARAFSRYRLDVAVLEQREDVCTGITRANTGIIYQGYDQHPGSMKARMCREASAGFPVLCRELDVPFRKTGLLMLSTGKRGDDVLEKKMRHSRESGIPCVRIAEADEVYRLEPRLAPGIRKALYAMDTYVVNPWELGIAAYENAAANGVRFFFREKAVRIQKENDGFLVTADSGTFRAQRILLTGGFGADRLWNSVGRPQIRIVPKEADYLVFDTACGNLISHILSVESEQESSRLTLVPTVDGNILAGPTRRPFSGRVDYASAEQGLLKLAEQCRKLLPDLPMDRVIRNFGSARPDPFLIGEDGSLAKREISDFLILEEDGLFGLFGVKTPGLTCSKQLGEEMVRRILGTLSKEPEKNASFDPCRRGILRVRDLIGRDPDAFFRLPKEYHEIICRCRKVSRGEILDAIRRGATTVNGVKRRTGALTGRCQGGYCEEQILRILCETLGRDPYSITKEGEGSPVLLGSLPVSGV